MSFANAYGNEIRMPARYVDLSAEEMEYEGGWSLKGLVASVVSCVVTGVIAAGIVVLAVGTGGVAVPVYIAAGGLIGGGLGSVSYATYEFVNNLL
ncbi:MAG: hypothetical protein LBM39_00225 [Candidatus Methanoplasma sp.]|nr:hypothetical protein [Candidatus Methanoplasma sp.]